jgi:TPR repeat protein
MAQPLARLAFLAVLATAGCGTKNLASKLQPQDPSAAEALGAAKCTDVGAVAEPFVVDLRGTERSHLEAAMVDGVAVMHYDCSGLRLVKGCKVKNTDPASYSYTGVSIKEDVVQLKNADELRANLPISAIQIEGELSSGVSLDIAMMMVGRRNTVLDTVTRDQLEGPGCADATHFVRSAIVGAFAVQKGSVGRARVAAEVFGAGVGAKSEADRRLANRDGEPEDCRTAEPGQHEPPKQCRAAITLELYPVVDEAPAVEEAPVVAAAHDPEPSATTAAKPVPPPPPSCPPGLVRANGMCTQPTATVAKQCSRDPKDCRVQCERGHGGSCFSLGEMLERGTNGLAKDPTAAVDLYERACKDRNHAPPFACTVAAGALRKLDLHQRADELLQRSCDEGAASSCQTFAIDLSQPSPRRDGKRAQALLDRGCRLGSASACSMLASSLMHGTGGAPKDPPRALAMLHKGCIARRIGDCMSAASALRAGGAVKADPHKALWYDERACEFGGLNACTTAGKAWLSGKPPIARDVAKARASFERGCVVPDPKKFAFPDAGSCDALFGMFTSGDAVERDPAQAVEYLERACKGGRLCAKLASVYGAGSFGVAKDPTRVDAVLRQGCTDDPMFEVDSCLALSARTAKTDLLAARELLKSRCVRNPFGTAKAVCKAYVKLGGKPQELVDRSGKRIQF